jgi:hypothetical protein
MGNQYSITVSDDANLVLDRLKKSGYKVSQVIDAVVWMVGQEGCARMVAVRRQLIKLSQELDE